MRICLHIAASMFVLFSKCPYLADDSSATVDSVKLPTSQRKRIWIDISVKYFSSMTYYWYCGSCAFPLVTARAGIGCLVKKCFVMIACFHEFLCGEGLPMFTILDVFVY